ncbi:MAG: 4-hydroxy-tetrahydrodipicolinate reductase [Alphaproteobacteria bacterium]|nr:4-hydroxy-tetrahydrodipicolinate reductase [Alphaproteobacteria bacterium]
MSEQSDIRFALPGASGRMGRMITKAVAEKDGVVITAATDRPGIEAIGADIGAMSGHGASGVVISDKADDLFARDAEVIVDFTTPDSSAAHAMMAAERGVAIVVGTTGLTDDHIATLKKAAEKTAVVWCANTSVGVTMLGQLVEDAVKALGEDWDIEIVEAHHKHKVDAPSGTALALGEAAARGRGVKLKDVMDSGRDGITGEREDGAIGFAVMRGGDVVGEHSVIFYGQAERVEITHRAMDRMVFARGAVRAGVWAAKAKPGLYDMKDVLS